MGIIERKSREKEQRRKDIVDAAETIFFEKGFEIATMQDIADRCELSKGTLYLYFTNKNELCLAIYARSLDLLYNIFRSNLEANQTAPKQILLLTEQFLDFIQTYPAHYRAMLSFRQHGWQCSEDNEIIISCQTQHQLISDLIIEIIEAGKARQELVADTDSQKLAALIWSNQTGIFSGAVLCTEDSIDQSAVDNLRYFIKLILQAITKE
ncbi:MAG: TetR/AcrR family transcriptional regulator [Candidatus Cloacimonadales bacterium]